MFSIKTAVVSIAKMNQGTTVLLGMLYAIDIAFKFKVLLVLGDVSVMQ